MKTHLYQFENRAHAPRSYTAMIMVMLALAALFSPFDSFAQFSRFDPATASSIDSIAEALLDSNQIVGLSIGVIKNGAVAYLNGYGMADQAAQVPATECTIYRLASVSKMFTAVAAMQLWEEGQLNLDADVSTYVNEYPAKTLGTVTSRLIMHHQSGMRHYDNGTGYDSQERSDYRDTHTGSYDAIAAVDIFKDITLMSTPGDTYKYSTFAYMLLGAVIERASGNSYVQQIRESIINPLGLPFLEPEFQDFYPYPNQAVGYDFDNANNIILADSVDISYKLPGGGYISSVIDLTLFVRGIVTESLFDQPNTLDTMRTPHNTNNNLNRGFGFWLESYSGTRYNAPMIYHGGDQDQTATMIFMSPDSLDGVAIMCNTEIGSSNLKPLARAILELLPGTVLEGSPFGILGPSFDLTGVENGSKTYTSNFDITAEDYIVTNSAKVKLIAAGDINLYPKFHARRGGRFQAIPVKVGLPPICLNMNKKGSELEDDEFQYLFEEAKDHWIKGYPNPFIENAAIQYFIAQDEELSITLHDLYGREVKRLVDCARIEAGFHKIMFDAADLEAGIYLLTLRTQRYSESTKLIKME